jgi:uncharacterized membrane protein YedE/YeeE
MFFLIAILCAATIGYLSQRTGLCMVRGVIEAQMGKPMFLVAILGSGVLIWVAGLAAAPFALEIPFKSYQLSVWAVLGGFLFGVGSLINGGCGVSTISKFARGQLGMLATIFGWVIGWILLVWWAPDAQPMNFTLAEKWHYCALIVASVVSALWALRLPADKRVTWLGMMGIGLLAGIVFIYDANWTPSSILHGVSLAVWNMDEDQWPRLRSYLFVAALVLGMAVAALRSHSFRLEFPGAVMGIAHFMAGILMGIGATLASGGNDTQLLLAMPALSPAGFATVFSILAGIYLGRRVQAVFDIRRPG